MRVGIYGEEEPQKTFGERLHIRDFASGCVVLCNRKKLLQLGDSVAAETDTLN